MPGISDAGIFHRWMNLFWTFREPEAVALLSPEESEQLKEFEIRFYSLPWEPLASHPHISQVSDELLANLIPAATRLLASLERRRSI